MLKNFRPRIRSRHPSHDVLRGKGLFPLFPFKSVIRLGSTTEMKDSVTNGGDRIELNTIEAIKNSSNKLLMKQCFNQNKVKTADWWIYDELKEKNADDIPFPIIAKHKFGSKGRGNYKINTKADLEVWLEKRKDRLDEYIFEKFHNYVREYRLHVSENGCFYTCRKMLKADTPDKDKWYRNDDHCVWIMEDNDLFDKPVNWKTIVNHSIKALKGVGLDFGAVDVKIQSATNKKDEKRKSPEFIIIEINSAPSFGFMTTKKYIQQLPFLLLEKYNKYKEKIEENEQI